MEELIKGLIDVALGNNDEDRHEEQRPRSSWAEVVSGNNEQSSHDHQQQNPWNTLVSLDSEKTENLVIWEKNEEGTPDHRRNSWASQEEGERNHGDWHAEHNRKPTRKTHKVIKDHWHGYKQPPSEQDYSNEVGYDVNTEPSQDALADLSKACTRLWELDLNRLVPGKDYEIDCGEGKKVYQKEDMAQGTLFSWLSDDVFKRPTYSRFCSLLDNYNPSEGCKEVVTSEERQEQAAFIEEISRTAPVHYLFKYLISKGLVSKHYEEFKRLMTRLWFDLYGRGGTSNCSSAFEHVFVGEIKHRGEHEVSGFHNWIQFYLEEAKGRVDYQGYIFPRRHGQIPDYASQLLTVQFEWNGVLKSLSTTLVGVSPEFEIALYTLCFYLGGEDNYVQLGPYPVNIKCYRLGDDKIGSIFPIAQD